MSHVAQDASSELPAMIEYWHSVDTCLVTPLHEIARGFGAFAEERPCPENSLFTGRPAPDIHFVCVPLVPYVREGRHSA